MAQPPLPPLSNPQKFGFDTDFFEIAVAPAVAQAAQQAPRPATGAPNSSQADKLAVAREEGFAAGLAEGRAQAAQAAALEVAELKNQLFTLTSKLEAAQTDWAAQQQRQAFSLLRLTLHHLIGHAASHYPDQLLEHFLHDLLPLLPSSEELLLRLHPQARTYHEKLGLPQASIGGRPFHVIPDASLGPADVIVEWRSGGLEARLPDILARIDTLLLGAGAQALPVPAAPTASGFSPQAAPANPPPSSAPASPPVDTTPPIPDEMAAISATTRARQEALLEDDAPAAE